MQNFKRLSRSEQLHLKGGNSDTSVNNGIEQPPAFGTDPSNGQAAIEQPPAF